jgi:hypothetical protein
MTSNGEDRGGGQRKARGDCSADVDQLARRGLQRS